jgi:hypothetical protein
MLHNHEGERALIGAIFDQAYTDAISVDKSCNSRAARLFISNDCELFRIYCELLDMNPEYVARRMQKRIADHDAMMIDRMLHPENYKPKKRKKKKPKKAPVLHVKEASACN